MTARIRFSFSTRTLMLATAVSAINIGVPALLLGWGVPAVAAPAEESTAASECAPPTAAQHRVLEAAANGVDALRNHLWIRRGVGGDDLVATVRWIDAYRVTAASCALSTGQVARLAPTASPGADERR